VSLVGFRFINTKLKGFRVPWHSNFEEVNLRFYVRYHDGTKWKRGVTFIKEIVPRGALTLVANTIYREKYITLPMRHSWDLQNDEHTISYHWKFRNQWNDFSVSAQNAPMLIATGSKDEFITEHYWGYTKITDKRTSEYRVNHPRWKIYPVKDQLINVDFAGIYGPAFAILKDQRPDSTMLAEGSEIAVLPKKQMR
jgi:uncharacterized protein YqjF (DUF2071 family)